VLHVQVIFNVLNMLINMCPPSLKECGFTRMFQNHDVKVHLHKRQANLLNLPDM
jgi:hypothetical protein